VDLRYVFRLFGAILTYVALQSGPGHPLLVGLLGTSSPSGETRTPM